MLSVTMHLCDQRPVATRSSDRRRAADDNKDDGDERDVPAPRAADNGPQERGHGTAHAERGRRLRYDGEDGEERRPAAGCECMAVGRTLRGG